MKKCAVALSLVLSFCLSAANVFSQENAVSFSMYSDPENKFYLQTPKGWIPADKSKSEIVVFIIVETAENSPVHSLNVQKIPITFKEKEDPKSAVDLLAQQLMDSLASAESFTIQTDNYYKINGRVVRILETGYVYEGKVLRQTMGILYEGGFDYAITYTAEETVYNEDIFNKAVSTFNVTK